MEVIERKPIPIYEITCCECKSKIRYKASEAIGFDIICPVCGVPDWANTIKPVFYQTAEEQ